MTPVPFSICCSPSCARTTRPARSASTSATLSISPMARWTCCKVALRLPYANHTSCCRTGSSLSRSATCRQWSTRCSGKAPTWHRTPHGCWARKSWAQQVYDERFAENGEPAPSGPRYVAATRWTNFMLTQLRADAARASAVHRATGRPPGRWPTPSRTTSTSPSASGTASPARHAWRRGARRDSTSRTRRPRNSASIGISTAA